MPGAPPASQPSSCTAGSCTTTCAAAHVPSRPPSTPPPPPQFQPLERGPMAQASCFVSAGLLPSQLCPDSFGGEFSLVVVACGSQCCNLQASSRWKKYAKSRTTSGQLGFCWMLAAHACPRLCGEARCPKFSCFLQLPVRFTAVFSWSGCAYVCISEHLGEIFVRCFKMADAG